MTSRSLEIYDLIGVGDSKTIELYNFINMMFSDLDISKQDDNYITYKNNNIEILQDILDKKLWIDGKTWSVFKLNHYIMNNLQIQKIIEYIMSKYYKINDYIAHLIIYD